MIPLFQVDAFCDQPFSGNPAGVCLLESPRPDHWMQQVAAEMNLSETAFLLPEADGYRLRWFTPTVEVDLCGHATLASTHVLFETGRLAAEETIRYFTRSGLLTACAVDGWIELNFPVKMVEPTDLPAGLQTALDLQTVTFSGKNQFDYLVECETEEQVRNLTPDFSALKVVEARGVIVTARSATEPFDFISRFFAPRVGVNEDPVTGSAHCALAPYWAKKLGKKQMTAYQASLRGGILRIRLENDRVILCGQAVTIFQADLLA